MKTLIILLLVLFPFSVEAFILKWDASTGVVRGYIVEVSIDRGQTWEYFYTLKEDLTTDPPTPPPTELFLDDKCQYNKEYYFRVSAYNEAGVSLPTDPLTWTRPAYSPPSPDKPLPPINDIPIQSSNLLVE